MSGTRMENEQGDREGPETSRAEGAADCREEGEERDSNDYQGGDDISSRCGPADESAVEGFEGECDYLEGHQRVRQYIAHVVPADGAGARGVVQVVWHVSHTDAERQNRGLVTKVVGNGCRCRLGWRRRRLFVSRSRNGVKIYSNGPRIRGWWWGRDGAFSRARIVCGRRGMGSISACQNAFK
jgi:hypothetical protein